MAEFSSVAGVTTAEGKKGGLSHPALMPTVVVFDPALGVGLPAWVRFGTALRCVEHAVGAATHPNADEPTRHAALDGLGLLRDGLKRMVAAPECAATSCEVYRGGWVAVRAIMSTTSEGKSCYPALGHLLENLYSAKFGVHQGACSGILCARLLRHHELGSGAAQQRIANVLLADDKVTNGNASNEVEEGEALLPRNAPSSSVSAAAAADGATTAATLVAALVATLPGVAREHGDVGVEAAALKEFAASAPLERLNALSPTPFADADELYAALTRPQS